MRTHRDLHLVVLDEESHQRTCNYWYLIRHGGTAHTAFETRDGVRRWLSERGMSTRYPIKDPGEHQFMPIIGWYRERWHGDTVEFAVLARRADVHHTFTLSNGDYVDAHITADADGIRTVHTLLPGVRDRQVYDYFAAARMMR